MNHSQNLEGALAEAERMLAEQDAELDAAFARLEHLGACPIHVDERQLDELANCQPVPLISGSRPFVLEPRC